MARTSTRIACHFDAPRSVVYEALLNPRALEIWRVPEGMTGQVHTFEGREGGVFRVSLSYDEPTQVGKTTARTDTYHGYFAKLVPNEQVVEVLAFETTNPAMQGQMTLTFTLQDAGTGTRLLAMHDGLPPGVSPSDNELGWRMALDQLARYVKGR